MPSFFEISIGIIILAVITSLACFPLLLILESPYKRWKKRRKIELARKMTAVQWIAEYPKEWHYALRYARKSKGDAYKAIELYCDNLYSTDCDDLVLAAIPTVCVWVQTEAIDAELGLTTRPPLLPSRKLKES